MTTMKAGVEDGKGDKRRFGRPFSNNKLCYLLRCAVLRWYLPCSCSALNSRTATHTVEPEKEMGLGGAVQVREKERRC